MVITVAGRASALYKYHNVIFFFFPPSSSHKSAVACASKDHEGDLGADYIRGQVFYRVINAHLFQMKRSLLPLKDCYVHLKISH